jgi:uncharacterized membrane protein
MPEEPGAGPGAEDRTPPGQTPERVSFFTDAVFAIAMTLLVIEIPRPDGADFAVGNGVSKSEAFDRLGHFLAGQWESFYAYFLTFLILWIVWRQHHRLFDQFSRATPRMVAWHFPLLLLAAFLPYASSTYGHYSYNPMAALLYGGVVTAVLFCRTAIQAEGLRSGVLIDEADRQDYRAEVIVSGIATGYWVLTLALVWWTPWVGIPWFFSTFVAALARRFVHRHQHAVPA